MKRPLTPPILNKLAQRAKERPVDCREGPLDAMLFWALVMIALGAAAAAIWGGR